MTKLDFDFFGAYVFALIVLGALVAAGIAYGQPMIVFLAVLSAGFGWLSSVAQIWQCGWGLLAPIIAPRFSKICTQRISSSAPSARYSSVHTLTTGSISSTDIRASVRSWRGEKQTTRQRPLSLSATINPPRSTASPRASARNAGKSLAKTKVWG